MPTLTQARSRASRQESVGGRDPGENRFPGWDQRWDGPGRRLPDDGAVYLCVAMNQHVPMSVILGTSGMRSARSGATFRRLLRASSTNSICAPWPRRQSRPPSRFQANSHPQRRCCVQTGSWLRIDPNATCRGAPGRDRAHPFSLYGRCITRVASCDPEPRDARWRLAISVPAPRPPGRLRFRGVRRPDACGRGPTRRPWWLALH